MFKIKFLAYLFVIVVPYNIVLAEDKKLHKAEWDFLFNPSKFNTDFSKYDQNTSIICCKLSYLAYYRKKDIEYAEIEFKRLYPNMVIELEFHEIKETGTQLIFFGTKKYVVVAFRGTEFSKFKDVRTDAKYFAYRTKPKFNGAWMNMPPGHGGFRKAIKSVIDNKIFDHLEAFISNLETGEGEQVPVYTTGHSLGAGLSIFAIEPIKYTPNRFNYSGTYTFAPPLTLSCSKEHIKEISKFEAENEHLIHNVVHYRDYVTRAGINRGSILKRVGHYYRICLNHEIVKNNPVAIRPYKMRRFGLLKYHTITNLLKYIQYSSNSNDLIDKRTSKKCICNEDQNQSYSDDLIPD